MCVQICFLKGLTLVLRRGVATTPNSFVPVLKNAQPRGKIVPGTLSSFFPLILAG